MNSTASIRRRPDSPVVPFPLSPLALLLLPLFLPLPASAQVAAPGDVFYSADVHQRFKYYVFANDFVDWANETIEGTSLQYSAAHDTAAAAGTIHIATAVDADGGILEFDLDSEMTLTAQFGIYHDTFNDLTLSIYMRGPWGTSFSLTVEETGLLQASRVGGAPGSLQEVNGISIAEYEEETLWIDDGGIFSLPLDTFDVIQGSTTTEILVDGETFSLAHVRVFTTYGSITQALCILGCMTEAADFHSQIDAHVAIRLYPGTGPTGAPAVARPALQLTLAAAPNPAPGATRVTFAAPSGSPTTIDVIDVQGRRVARLFDEIASGGTRSISWNAPHVPSGIYFLRAESGREVTTTKLTLVK